MNEEQLKQSGYFDEKPDKKQLKSSLKFWREIFRQNQSEHAARMCEKIYKEISSRAKNVNNK